jgi:hypothetical protein
MALPPEIGAGTVPAEALTAAKRVLGSDKVTVLRAYPFEIIASAPKLHTPPIAGSVTTSGRA